MMNKELFKKIAAQIRHPRPKFKAARPICPVREWSIGLLVAVLIVVGVSTWSFREYIEHQDTTIHEIDDSAELAVVYREGMVNEALEKFTTRQEKFDDLLGGTTFVVPEPEPIEEPPEQENDEPLPEEPPATEPTEEVTEEVPEEPPVIEEVEPSVEEPVVPEEEVPNEPDPEDFIPTLSE